MRLDEIRFFFGDRLERTVRRLGIVIGNMKGSRKAVALSRSAGGWNLRQRFTLAHGHVNSCHTTHLMVVLPTNLLSRYFCCSPSPTGESKAEPSSASDSRALLYASQEAERVLQLASTRGRNLGPESATDSLSAANALLLVSNPSNRLVECILHKTSTSQIGSIHRAFLAMISWCLDTVEFSEGSSVVEEQTVTLEATLALARRAHDLRLPLHLPLYKRLMETFATGKHASIGAPVQLITEIASWVVDALDAPMEASLFRSCICRLIEGRRLSDARELLTIMKIHYGIELLDFETTTEVLLSLRTIVEEEVSCSLSTSPEPMLYPAIHEEDVFDIAAFLEASLVDIFADTDSSSPDIMRENLKTLRGKLSQDEFEYLLERLADRLSDAVEKDKDTDDDDDPFNYAFRNILAKGVRNVTAKTMLSALIKHHQSGTDESMLSQPHLKAAGSFVDGENRKVSNNLMMESDERDVGPRITPSGIIYSRGQMDLPDITAQMERFHGGQKLLFTKEFEDMLWLRDYAEDVSLLESMVMQPGLDEVTDSDDDSEDDSDDDEDF